MEEIATTEEHWPGMFDWKTINNVVKSKTRQRFKWLFCIKSHSSPTYCCFPEKGIEFRATSGQSRTTFPDSSNTGGKQLITRAFKH